MDGATGKKEVKIVPSRSGATVNKAGHFRQAAIRPMLLQNVVRGRHGKMSDCSDTMAPTLSASCVFSTARNSSTEKTAYFKLTQSPLR